MGNAASDAAEDAAIARVETLRDQLADMERAVRRLNQQPQIDVLLPHQERVLGRVVACSSDVRILLGPVVGKVDAHSARVLLEVDRVADVTCHVLVHDPRTDAAMEVPQCSVRIRTTIAQRPTVFLIQSLLPGRRYRVVFSGVHREDARAKTGSFRTPTLAKGGKLHCAVVSADDAYDLEYGERSLWQDLRCAVVDEQRVQLVVHLGGQVAMRRMFDKAWSLLVRHAECVEPPVTLNAGRAGINGDVAFSQAWRSLEDQATEILRSAYRTQWTMMADKAHVLANSSNLMMWSDWEVYPAFTTSPVFFVNHEQPTLEMQVLRAVVRCARRVYHEYQRALWDDDIDQLFVRENELHRIAEQALATTARIHQLGNQVPVAQADVELQKKRREIEGARKAERHLRALEAEKVKAEKMLVSYNQLLAPQAGEEFVYRLDGVGFLFVDMRSARLEPGGSQRAENDLLSNIQWASIEEFLEDESLKFIFICAETPIVDDLPHELRLVPGVVGECDFKTWWGTNASAQQRLLGMVFEWKLQQEGRQATFLSGSCNTRFSMKTVVKDTRLRTDVAQWMTGPLTASASGRVIPSRSGKLFDRYSFEHHEFEAVEKTLLYVDVEATTANTSATETSSLVHTATVARIDGTAVQDPARVLLGPIIGHVDAISAVVLLEVDRTCDLVCVVTNLLTRERHRLFQHFEANRPNTFFANHLRSEHHYEISIERILDPDAHRGSFLTLAIIPERFQLIAFGSENSAAEAADLGAKLASSDTLWPWINDNLSSGVPFRGVDKVIHFEEGVAASDVAYDKQVGHVQDCAKWSESDHEAIKVKLRELLRLRWSMPGLRQLLSRGSHLILTGESMSDDSTDANQLVVNECIEAVQLEYSNLLLPPSRRAADSNDRLHNPIRFVVGAFGMFVLPNALTKTSGACTSFWKCLGEFLIAPRMCVVTLITQKPVVEDSIEDVEEKARFDSNYRQTLAYQRAKLVRLMEMLLTWQRPQRDTSGLEHTQKRRVVFLSGHQRRSFDSVFQDLTFGDPILRTPAFQQFVVGPFKQFVVPKEDASQLLQLNVFPQGTMFGKLGYYHRFQRFLPRERRENVSEETSCQPKCSSDVVSQLFHLQMALTPATDDKTTPELVPTFVVSGKVELFPPPSAAAFIGDDVAALQVVATVGENARWALPSRHPKWLETVVSQPITEHEEAMLDDMKALLDEKAGEVELSLQRADALAKGLIPADDRTHFVLHLQAAIEDFHHHVAGIAFRGKYPAIPSAYVINYTLEELSSRDGSAITGAIDLDLFRAILVKSLQNAALFDTRLAAFWP